MNTAVDQLFNLPSDKVEGDVFAEMLKKEIPAQRNPLNILVILKVFEKVLKDVLTDDEIDAAFLEDFRQHAEDNKLLVNGATLTSQEMGGKYDYSSDTVWTELDEKMKHYLFLMKDRENYLKDHGAAKVGSKQKVIVKL